jgi:hypothetical protein
MPIHLYHCAQWCRCSPQVSMRGHAELAVHNVLQWLLPEVLPPPALQAWSCLMASSQC